MFSAMIFHGTGAVELDATYHSLFGDDPRRKGLVTIHGEKSDRDAFLLWVKEQLDPEAHKISWPNVTPAELHFVLTRENAAWLGVGMIIVSDAAPSEQFETGIS